MNRRGLLAVLMGGLAGLGLRIPGSAMTPKPAPAPLPPLPPVPGFHLEWVKKSVRVFPPQPFLLNGNMPLVSREELEDHVVPLYEGDKLYPANPWEGDYYVLRHRDAPGNWLPLEGQVWRRLVVT